MPFFVPGEQETKRVFRVNLAQKPKHSRMIVPGNSSLWREPFVELASFKWSKGVMDGETKR